jgi:hypothetical protein
VRSPEDVLPLLLNVGNINQFLSLLVGKSCACCVFPGSISGETGA